MGYSERGVYVGDGVPATADRVFSADEVNAALELAGSADRFRRLESGWSPVYWWELGECHRIAALALGVLPEGWETHHASAAVYVLDSAKFEQWVMTVSAESGQIYAPQWYWPEAVRNGQAEIACRLLAAHVELDRLRTGGVK